MEDIGEDVVSMGIPGPTATGSVLEAPSEVAEELLRARIRMKTLSQLSYELREVDRRYPDNMYQADIAEAILRSYSIIEAKLVDLAEEINNS